MNSAHALPFAIDEMRLTDIPYVMAIERRVFPDTWSSGIYRRELTANPWSHYLAVRAARFDLPPMLAYGGVWQMDTAAHVPTIATHPDYGGRQLGSYVLLHLLLLALDLGCTEATLEVRISNERAQALYVRRGFKAAGRRKRYYGNDGEDALIMTRATLTLIDLQAELLAVEKKLHAHWQRHAGDGGVRTPKRLPIWDS